MIESRADARRRIDRVVNEMLGMLRGIVCDGVVTSDEVHGFQAWLAANPNATASWPGNVLADRVMRIASAGAVSESERHELYEMFCDTLGEGDTAHRGVEFAATRLPYDDPPPTLTFSGERFCFTGTFAIGERDVCESLTTARGGLCVPRVTKSALTIVVGTFSTDAWAHSSYGRKIETAMRYRDVGVPIRIVSEEHWTAALWSARSANTPH